MRPILLLLTLLLLLCGPVSAAAAWTPPPRTDEGLLARFLPLARAAWPGSPCAGREVVHLHAAAVMDADPRRLAGRPMQGLAAAGTCEVWITDRLGPLRFCLILVHELGHLAGRDHTRVPGDVMNGAGDIDYGPCEDALAPPMRVVLRQELRAMLPVPRRAWRIRCSRPHGPQRRCRAERGARVRHFAVTQTRDSVTIVPED